MFKQLWIFDANSIQKRKSETTGQKHTKECRTCGEYKPDCEFTKADGRHRATRNRCKECSNKQTKIRRLLRKAYPPPPPGACPICSTHTTDWVLDHCHIEGKFRGYICKSCNAGIGLLHDDPSIVFRAHEYLTTPLDETAKTTD